jgi:hypothetical protein
MPASVMNELGNLNWGQVAAYFFGGAFLTNAIPHFVSGVTGRPFQSPFARPPGRGLSSSAINVLWGWLNLAASYVLVCQIVRFDLIVADHAAAFGLGMLVMGLMAARSFGRFHGGNAPTR